MKKQNYTIGQRLMAYTLLTGLFLQSCNNPYVGPSFNKQEPLTKDEQPNGAALFLEKSPLATELQEPIEKEELVNKSPDSWLGDELANTVKHNAPESQLGTSSLPAAKVQEKGLATKSGFTTLKPSQLTQVRPKLPSKEKTKSKPVRERLQVQKLVHERGQQVKAPSTSLVVEQTPQLAKQEVEKAPMLTKGRYQMTFEKTSEGPWKAIVNESFQVGISRKINLPVFFELGYNFGHLADSHWVHVIEKGKGSFIWVGSVGIKGGMYQNEEDDNNNKSNRNRNNSKAEEVPSDLSGKLKYLYEQDNTLPKLIEDEDIPEQRIQDYYVKLQVVLQENFDQGRSAAAKDQVVGEKKPVEVDKLFDEIDKDHPAVSKILLLGGAGIGKSTLMHYISHQWAQGKLWKDKYEHVFRVRLKDLLDPTWAKKSTKSDLLARFIYSCLDRQKTALAVKGNEQLEEIGYDLDEIQQLLKDPSKKEKVLLLVDGYDEITNLKGKPEYQKIVDLGIFKHPKVIMTSRPNAASKEIRAHFERQVESQGLDEAGIKEYISLQFKQEPALAQKLKDFLVSNSQVRSMCEVPINTALLCITWKDPAISTKLNSSLSIETDFKLGQLYHELIVWLGKRHAIKYNPVHKDPKVLREIPDEAVL
jgi:GTPase SAR1 family protein